MKSKIVTLIVSSVLFPVLAFAHNGVKHAGKPLEGTATEIQSTSFKVKTSTGAKVVEVTKDTAFEIGMDGKKGTIQDLKDGESVMVEGTTLDSGELVATEVMVHSESAPSSLEHSKHKNQ